MKFFNVLLTTTLALSSCAVLAQLTEQQPKILFDSWTPAEGDDRQIYVMDPDGSNVQRLTEKQPGTVSGWAAWSNHSGHMEDSCCRRSLFLSRPRSETCPSR